MEPERPSAESVVRNLQSTSERIRALAEAGYERREISTILDVRYQHVRNVLLAAGITGGLSRSRQPLQPSLSRRRFMDVEGNIRQYLEGNADGKDRGRQPVARYASFDYCFNYFQSFREARETKRLASPGQVEMSCLHLGFYLASWGMLRGSTFLLQRSLPAYKPVIQVIATMDDALWGLDAHCYTEANIDVLVACRDDLVEGFGRQNRPSDTLITKVMLGVFGNVPAFDTFVKLGLGVSGSGRRALQEALREVSRSYRTHSEVIERYHAQVTTLDFADGRHTSRYYTRAKVLDMALFVEGQRLSRDGGKRPAGDQQL